MAPEVHHAQCGHAIEDAVGEPGHQTLAAVHIEGTARRDAGDAQSEAAVAGRRLALQRADLVREETAYAARLTNHAGGSNDARRPCRPTARARVSGECANACRYAAEIDPLLRQHEHETPPTTKTLGRERGAAVGRGRKRAPTAPPHLARSPQARARTATTPEPGAPSTLKLISGTSSGASEELVALVPRFRLLLMSGDCAAALTSEGMPVQRGPCRWLPARASAASAASTPLARIGVAGAADVRERRGRCAAPAGAAPPLVAAEAAAVAGG